MNNYPTTTTTNQGSVRVAQPQPSTWFKNITAEAKALTEQR